MQTNLFNITREWKLLREDIFFSVPPAHIRWCERKQRPAIAPISPNVRLIIYAGEWRKKCDKWIGSFSSLSNTQIFFCQPHSIDLFFIEIDWVQKVVVLEYTIFFRSISNIRTFQIEVAENAARLVGISWTHSAATTNWWSPLALYSRLLHKLAIPARQTTIGVLHVTAPVGTKWCGGQANIQVNKPADVYSNIT